MPPAPQLTGFHPLIETGSYWECETTLQPGQECYGAYGKVYFVEGTKTTEAVVCVGSSKSGLGATCGSSNPYEFIGEKFGTPYIKNNGPGATFTYLYVTYG
jgi:hypothetical protein